MSRSNEFPLCIIILKFFAHNIGPRPGFLKVRGFPRLLHTFAGFAPQTGPRSLPSTVRFNSLFTVTLPSGTLTHDVKSGLVSFILNLGSNPKIWESFSSSFFSYSPSFPFPPPPPPPPPPTSTSFPSSSPLSNPPFFPPSAYSSYPVDSCCNN